MYVGRYVASFRRNVLLPSSALLSSSRLNTNISPKLSYQLPSFDVLLTVHLSIFISVINQIDAQNFCFTISLFHASTCFEQMCSSSGGQNCITQPSLIITLKQMSGLKLLKYNSINMNK